MLSETLVRFAKQRDGIVETAVVVHGPGRHDARGNGVVVARGSFVRVAGACIQRERAFDPIAKHVHQPGPN